MKRIIILISIILFFFSCKDFRDDYFNTYPDTVDDNLWNGIKSDPQLSVFLNLITEFGLDSLFTETDNIYTVFAPTNQAFEEFILKDTIDLEILQYHITEQYIQPNAIEPGRRILTLSGKYISFECKNKVIVVDGTEAEYNSSLYNNGRFFKIDNVSKPLPNIYEYISKLNPVLKNYIDSYDSLTVDLEKSEPVGFNSLGQTEYDTVPLIINMVEEKYFPVKHELRFNTATLVFPSLEVYRSGLEKMASGLSGRYIDVDDISYEWQEKKLIPFLLDHGIFQHRLEQSEFNPNSEGYSKLRNILNDTVDIFYNPINKKVCSNGNVYEYEDFVVPDTLYQKISQFEMENLLSPTDKRDEYKWDESKVKMECNIVGNQPELWKDIEGIQPELWKASRASGNRLVKIIFPRTTSPLGDTLFFEGKYSIEFKTLQLFPNEYVVVFGIYYNIGGVFNIYINDQLVNTTDYRYYHLYQGIYYSNITGERVNHNNKFTLYDFKIDNIENMERVKVKIEYIGHGFGLSKDGFAIDYIRFIPINMFNGYENYTPWPNNQ
ncbi:MAG: fasciclin domain-containing protein [Prolixibacteraceae bacterium]|nr:fasciclin domain-containing protein [Prolixibacteraceae bacterium]